ncbi:MAG: SapC family protein [Hyphomonadaceae bacterium]
METPAGAQTDQITGNVLFYQNPEPLNHNKHGNLGVKQIDEPFGFLRSAHAVPLTVTEFGMAACSYPIIFVGDERTPIAVMGVRQGQNLYVTDEGRTDEEAYVPAFVRRYPFVFASDPQNDQLLLCVDSNAPMVSEDHEVAFFENGKATKFTEDAIEFCKEFERQRRGTLTFVEALKKHDLFEEKSISFQPRDATGAESGPPQKIADYWAISEERLNALSDEAFLELKNMGVLGASYAHFVSLLNWSRIIQRALKAPADGTA